MQSYAVEGRASRSEARDRFESGADGPRSGARGATAADTFTAAGSRYRTDLPRAETGFLGSSMPHARAAPGASAWRSCAPTAAGPCAAGGRPLTLALGCLSPVEGGGGVDGTALIMSFRVAMHGIRLARRKKISTGRTDPHQAVPSGLWSGCRALAWHQVKPSSQAHPFRTLLRIWRTAQSKVIEIITGSGGG